MNSSKRNFIKTLGVGSLGIIPLFGSSATPSISEQEVGILDAELVKEFVLIAHSDFDQVRKMLEKTPNLLNATQDWGDGDFESAIGAAGHMGLKEMANYLIGKGARFDIFVLTMLGKTEMVKSWIDLYPNLLKSIGPHGFTLFYSSSDENVKNCC